MVRGGEIHVWQVPVPGSAGGLARFEELLDREERARADRFPPGSARDQFVVARGAARIVLAAALDADPRGLRFVRSDRGKPYLTPDADGIDFSVSHSARLAAVAVGSGRAVGVDVERVREPVDVLALARRALPPAEQEALAALSGDERRLAFFRLWTRAEACLKALGIGLAGAHAPPHDPAVDCVVHSFEPGPGYAGAVASDRPFQLRIRRLDPIRR